MGAPIVRLPVGEEELRGLEVRGAGGVGVREEALDGRTDTE